MSGFSYRRGELFAEEVPVAEIAAAAGTPVYVYSAGAVRERFRAFAGAFADLPVLFCYAVKANPHLAILRLLSAEGAGADTVSGGEILRALAAGVPPSRIVFAGVAKTDEEMRLGLDHRILQFNVESLEELERLDAVARETGTRAPVAIRINPDVAAGSHDKISTGRRGDKFGVPIEQAIEAYERAVALPGIEPVGLHLHIGSQIAELAPFARAYRRAVELWRDLRARGIALERIDFGGGFGIRYREETPLEPATLAALVRDLLAGASCRVLFEPGRALVADAGVLVSRVIYRKETRAGRHLVVDAGMHTLMRPALYDAWHDIFPVREPLPGTPLLTMDVVGPICESSDILGRDRRLPALGRGDLIAVGAAGAYGAAMVSNYNSRPRPAEVLVEGERWAVIKPRVEPSAQFADEIVPPWLAAPEESDRAGGSDRDAGD